jgi:hypothetical protein
VILPRQVIGLSTTVDIVSSYGSDLTLKVTQRRSI